MLSCEKQYKQYRNHMTDIDEKINVIHFRQAWNEETKRQKIIEDKRQVLLSFAGRLPYKQYLILYDLCHGSYYELAEALERNKINHDDINSVLDMINIDYPNMFNVDQVYEFISIS